MKTQNKLLRKTLSILMFVGIASNTMAQSGINNLSFETWTTNILPGSTPLGWYSNNTSEQTTGAQHGNKYARITTVSSTNSGFLALGDFGEPGDALSVNPLYLTGFYRTNGMQPGDQMTIMAMTSKSGTTGAIATFTVNSNVGPWTSFNVPFAAVNQIQADTIQIFITNTPGNATGSVFDVDNLALLTTAVGIDQRSKGTAFLVYPNPATNVVNVISKDESATIIILKDVMGKKVSETSINSELTSINLEEYQPGIYFYTILNFYGTTISSNKIVIVK